MRLKDKMKEGIVLQIDLSHLTTLSLVEGRKKLAILSNHFLEVFSMSMEGSLKKSKRTFKLFVKLFLILI
jgi:hypothetical protein